MSTTYSLKIQKIQKGDALDQIRKLALENYSCEGVQEFSFNEAQVDKILGDAAYCGGELPDEVLKRIEEVHDQPGCEFFFADKEKAEKFQQEVKSSYQLMTEMIEYADQDWNEEWKKFYQPIVVDDFLIVPAWEKNYESKKHTVYIHPGMAFGTGDHPTTYLCLFLLQLWLKGEFSQSHRSFLDLGCGSGILGISALKAGFQSGEFCDIDPVALNNCRENFRLNQIQDSQISFLDGPQILQQSIPHDFVFANILAPILIENAELIAAKTKRGGGLVLSGLLVEQEESVLESFHRNFEIIHIERREDWSGILLRRL